MTVNGQQILRRGCGEMAMAARFPLPGGNPSIIRKKEYNHY